MTNQSLWNFVSLEYETLYKYPFAFNTKLRKTCRRILELIETPPPNEEILFQSLEKIKNQFATIEIYLQKNGIQSDLKIVYDIIKLRTSLRIITTSPSCSANLSKLQLSVLSYSHYLIVRLQQQISHYIFKAELLVVLDYRTWQKWDGAQGCESNYYFKQIQSPTWLSFINCIPLLSDLKPGARELSDSKLQEFSDCLREPDPFAKPEFSQPICDPNFLEDLYNFYSHLRCLIHQTHWGFIQNYFISELIYKTQFHFESCHFSKTRYDIPQPSGNEQIFNELLEDSERFDLYDSESEEDDEDNDLGRKNGSS